jgi:hypothetical protein
MQLEKTDSMRKLLFAGTLVVLAHFVAVIWHVVLLIRLQPGFPAIAIVSLIVVNLLPIAGLVAFAKGFHKSAGCMILVPLGVALVGGGYTHFLSSGSDNVLHILPGPLRLPYQLSAILLVLLEAARCFIAVRMFVCGRSSTGVSRVPS